MLYGLQDVSDNTRSASTCSFARFLVSWCILMYLSIFILKSLVGGISSTCFYPFPYLFIFYHFQISIVEMRKKEKKEWEFFRDCNVSFEEWDFFLYRNFIRIALRFSTRFLGRNKILSIFRNFGFSR